MPMWLGLLLLLTHRIDVGATNTRNKTRLERGRGIGWGFKQIEEMYSFGSLGWWYNWGTKASPEHLQLSEDLDMEFVPMIWGQWGIERLVESIPPNSTVLLGFNEPNHGEQANMLPAKAAALWPQLEKAAKQWNLRIASPAAAPCGKQCTGDLKSPFDWWDQFFGNCTDCQVDILATHYYGCDVQGLKWYLDQCRKYGLPIWLTEFDCPNGMGTLDKQREYMLKALALLDDAEDVERIAWFTARTNDQWIGTTASLLEADSPSLTPLGRRYVSYGLPADERDVPHEEATKMLTDEDAANDYTDALEDGPQVSWKAACDLCVRVDQERWTYKVKTHCEDVCGFMTRSSYVHEMAQKSNDV